MRVYRNLYRTPSGPVQAPLKRGLVRTPNGRPAYGCKGPSSLRSSTPCPLAVPHHSALLRSRDGDARSRSLRLKGKGLRAPAPHSLSLARRLRVGKLAVTTAARLGRDVAVFWRASWHLYFVSQTSMGIDHSPNPIKERTRKLLRWLDGLFLNNDKTFPIYRSSDGSAIVEKNTKKGQLIIAEFLETAPAAKVFEKERFQVTALRGRSADDEPCFWLDMQLLDPNKNEWVPLLMIHQSRLNVIRFVLDDVYTFLRTEDPTDCGCGL